MKKHKLTNVVAAAFVLTTACTTQADTHASRHQIFLDDGRIVADQTAVKFDENILAQGDFYHLRSLTLVDGSTVFGAVEGNSQKLHLWSLEKGQVMPIWDGEITTRVVEDICFYESRENQQLTVFLLGGRGGAEQRLLQQDSEWLETPLTIREMNVPFDSTACEVSQVTGKLLVAEADQAIWSYNAEPEVDEGRDLIAAKKPFGELENEMKALQLLADGNLLVLEEEPPRLLVYRPDGESYRFNRAHTFADISALTDIALISNNKVVLTEENLNAEATLEVEQGDVLKTQTATPVNQVAATLETQPSPRRGDAIDDPAVWVNSNNPDASRILATDKRTGLYVYDMQGQIVQELAVGRLNNVDVRGQLAAATLRDDNSIQLFTISDNGELKLAANQATDISEIYGLCMGFDDAADTTSVYVNGKSGRIQHYTINSAQELELQRELQVPSQPEGCVVDDASQRLFVGEEDVAVWMFDAAVQGSTAGEMVVKVADHPQLVDDIEGLAYANVDGEPLLFVSSQGNDSYIVFEGQAPWSLRSHFRIRTNTDLKLDGASETDGIEVTTFSLGQGFEQGAFLVQDGRNRMPEDGQNVKLVPLEMILRQLK